jgi:SAM-dependent methyltransferase
VTDEVIERSRTLWGLGEYEHIARRLEPAAAALVEACAVSEGQRVLDVAAGTGNVALEAARRGARVTATDLSPVMIEKGRARTVEAGLAVEWGEANAEDLPFADGSFDVVTSCFGAIFAPRHELVATELTRVAAGGVVGLTSWAEGGINHQMRRIMAEYLPPPTGAADPMRWGDESYVRGLFDGRVDHLLIERRPLRWEFDSIEEARHHRESHSPPLIAFRAAVGEETARAAGDRMDELILTNNKGTDGRVAYDTDYLLITARARS